MGMAAAGMAGMDLTQAAYRYNHNMMEYYTCKQQIKTIIFIILLIVLV